MAKRRLTKNVKRIKSLPRAKTPNKQLQIKSDNPFVRGLN